MRQSVKVSIIWNMNFKELLFNIKFFSYFLKYIEVQADGRQYRRNREMGR